jgi:adenylosuccinate synthase
MPNLAVVGAQWGDEGKGKMADYLAQSADMVVRYQGGPNAGHTVCLKDRELTFHQIPSGITSPKAQCIIGCGCVVDPHVLNRELAELRKNKIRPGSRLAVDRRAHMILPYHRLLDKLQDSAGTIGTTGQGIGPAYRDKFSRTGIRAVDLLSEEVFAEKLVRNLAAANFLLMELHKAEPLSFKKVLKEYWQATRTIARLVADGSSLIEAALRRNDRVLFEGAQGMHLDIDLGTYPYVTSSSTWVGGVAPGAGVSPLWLEQAVGVVKAYTTRVGKGPFPTELDPADAENLRKLGHEYGATTGRPRRCGWFDAPLVRAAVRYNRLSAIIITKLDVLDSLDTIKVCHSYRLGNRTIDEFDLLAAFDVEPQYEELPGWKASTAFCRTWRDLPVLARRYVTRLEELVNCPVAIVSTGKDRGQTIPVRPAKLTWLKSR